MFTDSAILFWITKFNCDFGESANSTDSLVCDGVSVFDWFAWIVWNELSGGGVGKSS
jgi:hypothetical protein